MPFQSTSLTISGSSTPILEGVSSTLSAGGDFAFAKNGTFIYLAANTASAETQISWVDGRNKPQQVHLIPGQYLSPRFSPDGKRLAFSLDNGRGADIWVKDLDRDTPSRLSFLPGMNSFPVWTPDGKHIIFRSSNQGAPGLYATRSDGSAEQRLTDGTSSDHPQSVSPDGKRLAIHYVGNVGNNGSYDISTLPVETGPGGSGIRLGQREVFLRTPLDERNPAFSPDGHWMAYASNESGKLEVYVRPFPGPGGRSLVSAGGGHFPVWSRVSRELLFESLDQKVMAVSFSVQGDSFVPGQPRLWAEARLRQTSSMPNYDLAPDGKRLAAIVADDQNGAKPPTHMTFLLSMPLGLRVRWDRAHRAGVTHRHQAAELLDELRWGSAAPVAVPLLSGLPGTAERP